MLNSVEVEFRASKSKKKENGKCVALSNIQLKNLDLFEIKTRDPRCLSSLSLSLGSTPYQTLSCDV